MKFTIFKKSDKDVSKQANEILSQCEKHGFVMDDENPDVVFVLGGDGTFLKAARHYLDKIDSIKFVGFRCGTLGFFYDFEEEDISRVIEGLEKNIFPSTSYKLLECHVNDDILYAVNEIAIAKTFHSIECVVKIDGVEFENFTGNGLVLCTPLGSTGYNRSLGGAVINHDVDVIELCEISSIQNRLYNSLNSPLILSPKSVITLEGDFSEATLGYDNKSLIFEKLDKITIKQSSKIVNIVYDTEHSPISPIKRSFIR